MGEIFTTAAVKNSLPKAKKIIILKHVDQCNYIRIRTYSTLNGNEATIFLQNVIFLQPLNPIQETPFFLAFSFQASFTHFCMVS